MMWMTMVVNLVNFPDLSFTKMAMKLLMSTVVLMRCLSRSWMSLSVFLAL